ncbi:hypothetical protein ACQ86O_11480 [Serratia sp. L9]|uniref:hypothetical protein n=1 Tax=Serratia sp. L9 TaxID=3423946 RepID=UPI003D669C2A
MLKPAASSKISGTGRSLLFNIVLSQMAPQSAYHYRFFLAAASTPIPMLHCLRVANRAIVRRLNIEQECS